MERDNDEGKKFGLFKGTNVEMFGTFYCIIKPWSLLLDIIAYGRVSCG